MESLNSCYICKRIVSAVECKHLDTFRKNILGENCILDIGNNTCSHVAYPLTV